MADIHFIRDNPATEAFQRGQRVYQDLLTTDIANDGRMQQNAEQAAGMKSRLRSLEAGAGYDQTRADVAAQTAPYDVSVARENAAQAPIKTSEAQLQANENQATSADRITQSGQNTRLGEVKADNAELDGTYKVIDLLDQGDVVTARAVAKQLNVDLPDSIVNNRLVIKQLKALSEQAKTQYPNSPKRQQQFMTEAVKGLTAGGVTGEQNRADPGYPFKVDNAPEPDMDSSTGRAGKPLQFEVIRDAAKALGYSDEEAFNMASGRKPPSDMELMNLARQLTSMEMPSSDFRTSPEDRRQRYQQILADLRSGQQRQPAGADPNQVAPGAAPAPAAAGAAPTMDGDGSQAKPFQATTQDQVDWFKNSAPPGSIIVIDGQLYTK